jgi:hypothetical protein
MKTPTLRVDGLTVKQLQQLIVNNHLAAVKMLETYNQSTSSGFKRSLTSKIRQHELVIQALQIKIKEAA